MTSIEHDFQITGGTIRVTDPRDHGREPEDDRKYEDDPVTETDENDTTDEPEEEPE